MEINKALINTRNKAQPFYILWILENYENKDAQGKPKKYFSQQDIVNILNDMGYPSERKSVANDLKMLVEFGFKIHGIVDEDEYGRANVTRGKIWLEKDISDEKLQILIDSICFSTFINKAEAKQLVNQLVSLGSKELKKKSATSFIDGGQIYHEDDGDFFAEVRKIKEAMTGVNGSSSQISFKYAQYKFKNKEIVLEKEREHIVSPYYIVPKKGNYYLIGYNHKAEAIWHYRLDYVKNVNVLKAAAKQKRDTVFKTMSIGEYVDRHPYMFAGDIEGVYVKVNSDKFGIVKDTFGSRYKIESQEDDYFYVQIYCSELDAFHWAMQYGAYIEVLSPQKLRNAIRTHVEGMALKYLQHDGDRYSEAIKGTKNNGDLNLCGIEIGSRTKHKELVRIKTLKLSDNKLSDISFLKNYQNLYILHIANNPISDISVLENLDTVHTLWLENIPITNLEPVAKMKGLKHLHLNLGRNVDYSAISKMTNLKTLTLPENDSYYLKWDGIDGIEENLPELEIRTSSYKPKQEAKRGGDTTSPYPLILFKEALGYNIVLNCDDETATKVADTVLNKLSASEKEIATLYYKNGYNNIAISEDLSISIDEFNRVIKSVKDKITHASYNGEMEKYVSVKKLDSTNAMEKLKEMCGIDKK